MEFLGVPINFAFQCREGHGLTRHNCHPNRNSGVQSVESSSWDGQKIIRIVGFGFYTDVRHIHLGLLK